MLLVDVLLVVSVVVVPAVGLGPRGEPVVHLGLVVQLALLERVQRCSVRVRDEQKQEDADQDAHDSTFGHRWSSEVPGGNLSFHRDPQGVEQKQDCGEITEKGLTQKPFAS